MSSLTSSRPSIYSPQLTSRSHNPQTPHPIPPPATPLHTVHPPATPAINGSKQLGPTSSTGYFGLVIDPNESTLSLNHAQNNWSPSTSSMKSTAAKSPRPVVVDGLPETFQKQAQALAFNLHNQSHPTLPESRYLPGQFSGDKSGFISSPTYFSPPLHPLTEGEHSEGEGSISFGGIARPQFRCPLASPFPLKMETLHRPSDGLSRPSPLTFPPISSAFGMCRKVKDTRPAPTPVSSVTENISMIAPEKLAQLLKQEGKSVLLLDLRTYPQYAQARIHDAIHLCIPTTLLKRPSFNVTKLSETFANDADKARFSTWRKSKYIVVYDSDSQAVKDAMSAFHTVNKFVREGWTGDAFCIQGGFMAFSAAHPEKVDATAVGSPNSPKSLSLTANGSKGPGMVIGGFNCQLPPQTSVCNPFFSNIRQNMDLIGGVGEIPIKIPQSLSNEIMLLLPTWLRKIASEAGSKLVAERFYAIEKAEQERMQKALNVSVTYDTSKTSTPARHTLAGVEKGSKNRYNNIWPYDHARVRLKNYPEDSCDYINASYIKASRSRKRYIATQGPLPTTFQDFWSVVWEQDVRVIVMLTAESEGGQVKCHSYWTDERYGPLVLTKRSEELVSLEKREPKGTSKRRSTTGSAMVTPTHHDSNIPHIIVRRFSLCHDNYPFDPIREITQLQYSSWPDFGAPAHPAHILALIEHTEAVIRSSRGQKPLNLSTSSLLSPTLYPGSVCDRPTIVHCSAGCGRTGTFCAVDTVIDMLRRQRLYQQYGGTSPGASEAGSDTDSCTEGGHGRKWLGQDEEDIICQVVSDFRDQRLSMVQSLRQFVLCYETVLEWMAKQKPLETGKRKA